MKTIWKFYLPRLHGLATIQMPRDAEVISCGNQDEKPTIWTLTRKSEPYERRSMEERVFFVAYTGADFPEFLTEWRFVGTVLMGCGSFVVHLFEQPKELAVERV